MEKDLDRVLNLITAEEIKIKQKNSIISQNTNDVIELLTSKMEYFKFKYQDKPFNERYDYIMSFLKGNFEEFDENTIKLILIKDKQRENGYLGKINGYIRPNLNWHKI